MMQPATRFPLGQRLLLAPLTNKLNDKNLNALNQLLKKQALFCKETTLVVNHNVWDINQEFPLTIKGEITQWTLHKVLMELAHPEKKFVFHAIDWNQTGRGITIKMLLNAASHRSNAV